MSLQIKASTALNLELQGSVGKFCTSTKASDLTGIEVKYFLTHVGLDFENGNNSQALNFLAPVRELFDANTLEFDEIMQRDIDDSRVSAELIPYLLNPRSRDLVKLFPPIIVVVLPTEPGSNRPANKYPNVSRETLIIEEQETYVTRSGAIGKEVFQFQQPVANGEIFEHDLTRLKLNTNRCKLVIVDGQHRAMALLAIYRNLKQDWTDSRRAPFKDYYEEWTPNYIKQFELKKLNMPVMFCTFPALDESYDGDYDLKKAARSVFLTLNKNARPVSESRNRLLDDNDLVALCLRNVLSKIKEKDIIAPHSLRIHNVELDQFHDRKKIESPMSITGVNHIYYLIEHLLLNDGDNTVKGVKPRTGKYWLRSDLSVFETYERLGNARDVIGSDLADSTTRYAFSTEAGKILANRFFDFMGVYIVGFFEKFLPIEAHNKASLWLEEQLRTQENQKLRPIIFEGQGLSRVFENHRENLKKKQQAKEFGEEATKIDEIISRLDATTLLINKSVENFKAQRTENFFASFSSKPKLKIDEQYSPKVRSFIDDIFDNLFSTVAFQTAAIASFFTDVEYANKAKAGKPGIDKSITFESYIADLNAFFVPSTVTGFKHLVSVFTGDLEGDVSSWSLTKTKYTFREVVYPGEMQPDQWPKYRYLLLELWRPTDEELSARVSAQRNLCRGQVFNSLYERMKNEYLATNQKREENLFAEEREALYEKTYLTYVSLLKNLGWDLSSLPKLEQFRDIAAPKSIDVISDDLALTDPWDSSDSDS